MTIANLFYVSKSINNIIIYISNFCGIHISIWVQFLKKWTRFKSRTSFVLLD